MSTKPIFYLVNKHGAKTLCTIKRNKVIAINGAKTGLTLQQFIDKGMKVEYLKEIIK
jgi:hypothetical protein